MKKFLFRGKDRSGKWRYGDLLRRGETLWIVQNQVHFWQVNPSTVSWRFVEVGQGGELFRDVPGWVFMFNDSVRHIVNTIKQFFKKKEKIL